ncbi:hypothetical protein [Allofournierella sp. CML151]|uniref:hypothetical protein n=1 Tax=Allofournierella sp. CML151 TaxID=2998082 RepID=UPI0022EA5CB6|nr:hypothetical protein [Fournierella sp. CML151]
MSELDFLRNVLGLQQEDLLAEALTVCKIKNVPKGYKLFDTGENPTPICLLVNGVFRGYFGAFSWMQTETKSQIVW